MLENIETMKNEYFALTCMKALFESDKMSESLLYILLDKDKCCNVIGGHYFNSILKEIDSNINQEELTIARLDGTSKARYLKTILTWNGRSFIVTNYWYGPNTKKEDNRTPFLNWIEKYL